MIVTCPGCAAKYRVKNDSVPADGARMKCPKCSTLFLARPPAGGEGAGLDESSKDMQALLPQTGNTGNFPAVAPPTPHRAATPMPQMPRQPTPAPAPAPKASGPVTALFGAVDPAMLAALGPAPPLPPQPAPPSNPNASGLEISDAPKVRTAVMPPSPTAAGARAPLVTLPPPRGARSGPGVLPFVMSGVSAAVFVVGALVFLWASEIGGLDATLTPLFAPLGAKPLLADEEPLDGLRQQAKDASGRGDFVAAITAWERVDARDPNDPRARTEVAGLRQKLTEEQKLGGAPAP